jgi:hypothetical protein
LKPVSSTPAVVPEPSSKSGTTIVKSAPPKETSRITVKPNLPATAVRAGGNFPTAKPAAGAVPVAAAAAVGAAVGAAVVAKASAKPATTIVKTAAAPKVAAATIKPAAGSAPVAASAPAQFQEEGSTTLTTVTGRCWVLTWGTAAVCSLAIFAISDTLLH